MLELMDPPAGGSSAPARRYTPLPRSIRLLVVDAHPVARHGVRLFLDGASGVRSVDEAGRGQDAIDVARRIRPDVALLDPWLPDMLLAEAVRRIGAVSPGTRIVVFAGQVSPSLREEAATLGVHGILGKDATPERLLDALCAVARGDVIEAPPSEEMLRWAAEKVNGTPLTPREHEVLRRAARGESNAEIAGAIYLAPTTVKSYLQSALRKLGARNRVEAVFKLSELRIL